MAQKCNFLCHHCEKKNKTILCECKQTSLRTTYKSKSGFLNKVLTFHEILLKYNETKDTLKISLAFCYITNLWSTILSR